MANALVQPGPPASMGDPRTWGMLYPCYHLGHLL
ncbi:MFS transporter [Aspergillus luchuensis]|uniref:MFS transporter n=1 Tax=Aspergillus kawachii TaxID=1069201 RepID=A0A146F6G3_ASPKA|nr:MFS transporter [Aspergillus luchuensis]